MEILSKKIEKCRIKEYTIYNSIILSYLKRYDRPGRPVSSERGLTMIFIGDFFALALVIILFVFFFDSKTNIRYMTASSKLFIGCLVTTAITAMTDVLTGELMMMQNVPLWKNMLVNSFYFFINIITTSFIALYLFTKILEHTHDRHCMKRAIAGLSALFCIYMVFIIANLWNGWLFYFDAAGQYCRGPLNVLGYMITLMQMVLIVICYFRNRKNSGRPMRRILLQTFPVIPIAIVIQRIYPEIMLNALLMAMFETVLFLSFQGQRQGVHTLTELNDRHRFFTEVSRRITKKEPFQIFLINIKNFGAINQKHGHQFGDEFLYQFAFSLEKLMNDSLSFHMNGTVFATILPFTYQNVAEKQSGIFLDFLERGLDCMSQHVNVDYVMAHYISDGYETSAAEIYENMEYAIAKTHGLKQRYICCTREIREETIRRRQLRERIQIVDRVHGFEVWFQPIKCLATGKFCSMEALVRLREPDGSLISPAEFIPLAEQTGQIAPITWFVLEEVCRSLKYTPALDGASVSINLPMAQLLEKGFIPRFTSVVNQAGIEHQRICIEFTERAILENFEQTKRVMEELTQDGFLFYLDDFGAGYSNFNCLLQLPFGFIKLDRCLVHSGKDGQPDYETVRTLTKLLHDLGLTVVAEGAETDADVQALTSAGVDRIQGFVLAHPMDVNELMEFYEKHPLR